jgi:hypothetical protein
VIFLHIGRGKAGSTAIQSLLAQSKQKFLDHGYECPAVDLASCVDLLMDRDTRRDGSRDCLETLSENCRTSAHKNLVLSCEYLFAIDDPSALERLRDCLLPHSVRIIIYLRDYPSLVVSMYNQSTKKGLNLDTFDQFFDRKSDKLSPVASVSAWATVFGWDSIRIRSLDRRVLEKQDLISDFLNAIEFSSEVIEPASSRANKSESWIGIELRRALAMAEFQSGRQPSKDLGRKVIRALRQLPNSHDLGVQYLTPEQWELLRASNNSDLDSLRSAASEQASVKVVHLETTTPEPRPFLPTVNAFPQEVIRHLSKLLIGVEVEEPAVLVGHLVDARPPSRHDWL